MSAECKYKHNTSKEYFNDITGEKWECSREAVENGHCLFHASPNIVADEEVESAFLEAVKNKEKTIALIGARLGSVNLDYAILDGPSNHPIDLRDAEINGILSARYATVMRPLRFENAQLKGSVDLEDATFARRVDFSGATFQGRVSFRMASFESWLDVRDVDFYKPVYMRVATFENGIYGVNATFHAAADFLNTKFEDVANFYKSSFYSGAIFDSSTFEGNAQFYEATLNEPAIKLDSATGSPRSEREHRDGVALSLDGVTCKRDLRLSGATLDGDIKFTQSELGRELRSLELSTSESIVIDCSHTAVVSGEVVGNEGSIKYDLTQATVGEIDIEDAASFNIFQFGETTFNGFDFGSYKKELSECDWEIHDPTKNSSPNQLENLYLRAKNGSKEVGETRASAEFFIKEMIYRRAGYRQRILSDDNPITQIKLMFRWLSNITLQATCGFGERPFRPLIFSVGSVLVFAGVYALISAPIEYNQTFGYIIFSIEGFISLILGLPETTNPFLSFIIAVEGFIGGFMIALFVFTLTRSVSR